MLDKIFPLVVQVVLFPVIITWRLLPRFIKHKFLHKLIDLSDTPFRPKSFESLVLPHGPLIEHYKNLWSLEGTLPARGPKLPRNMVVYRIPSTSSLIIHSPICVREEVLKEITELGEISIVIVPTRAHRLDCAAWAQRFPNAKFLAPSFTKKYINTRVPDCKSFEQEFPEVPIQSTSKPNISYMRIGMEEFELAYLLKLEGAPRPNAFALVVCDAFFNLDKQKAHWTTRFIGSAEGFGVTTLGTLLADNPKQMLDWMWHLRDIAQTLPIESIFMAHGTPIMENDKVIVKLNEATYGFAKSI